MNDSVADRLASVHERIAAACHRVGRDRAAVTLIAASKGADVGLVEQAVAAGQLDFGENRAQDLVAKADRFGAHHDPHDAARIRWHFLGRLQRNKVAVLAPRVTEWHSVDREELGIAIARRAPGARVLVQVNLAREAQKGGCDPDAAPELVGALRALELQVTGLMIVPPATGDPRSWFAGLRDLGARLGVAELSMGMSGDFEIAVEEGATIVRVGRAIFGARPGRGSRP